MCNGETDVRTYYSSVQNTKGQQTKRQNAVAGWDRAVFLLPSNIMEGIATLMEKSETGWWKEQCRSHISSAVRPFA